jgi:acetoacetyl-CoA synthetase|tara:strand:+ start:1041 stop:2993 length:1953 start_codon:yes stop_codon:yes gene_type:complete
MSALLWKPTLSEIENSQAWEFIQEANKKFNISLENFHDLYKWSCKYPKSFWELFWGYSKIIAEKDSKEVLKNGDDFLGSEWFSDSKLNFAKNLLSKRDQTPAIVFWGEDKYKSSLTHSELYNQVARLSHWLKKSGVRKGDRVAGLLPNMSEAVVSMLATSSIGAIWTSCSPDFGVQGVLDRFGQVKPKVFICVDAYLYNGKVFNCLEKNAEIIFKLPSIENTLLVRYIDERSSFGDLNSFSAFDEVVEQEVTPELIFESVAFNDPLYILFSSGTTGVPKCIVHGVGGTLIQHKKEHTLHCDIKEGERIFYFSTCGWMMWNWLVSSLASGATLMLYDGSPILKHNDSILFDYVDQEQINVMGVSAKFLDTCRKTNLNPNTSHNLKDLRMMLSTGSVLSADCFDYVYECVKEKICLSSISGGTDIVSCFVLGSTILPVYQGELQTRGLGLSVEVWNELGESVVGEKGELVCTNTFPSKPVMFWNDKNMDKYKNSYFERYSNVWCHGDYVRLMETNGMIFYGRSDTTLNRGGVRIGTAEIYRQVETLIEVLESVVVEQAFDDDSRIILFVKLNEGLKLSDELKHKIVRQIRSNTSPRHVPDIIIQVSDIPRTKSGKIVELAVQKAIHNLPIDNKTALENPEVLKEYYDLKELQ